MPIRYSSIVGGGGADSGFNLDVGASGNTTFVFPEPQPAGGYSVTSQLADATIEFYAISESGALVGYTNTKALTATEDFSRMVVYGAANNDLITFEFKPTTLPTGAGDQDSGAAPYISSVSDADLAIVDETTIVTGGNFATDVVVTFTGTDSVVRNAKSVVRTNSNQLIVTRPDNFLQDNSPYTLRVSNPGIPQSAFRTITASITAGGDPVWVTASGALPGVIGGSSYTTTLQATDPDGGAITYSVVTGQLPAGLSLNSSTGVISGTSLTGGTQVFTVQALDAGGNTTNRSFSLAVTAATGGTVTDSGGFRTHTFTSNGTFQVFSAGLSASVLVVAGAGGGGGRHGGGGGAGGYLQGSRVLEALSYPIVVGAGGAGTIGNSATGNSGSASSAFSATMPGGGGGGAYGEPSSSAAGNGGSGGGEGHNGAVGSSVIPAPAWGTAFGNNGGTDNTSVETGGGGGAGAIGGNAAGGVGGVGGAGRQWIDGLFYAGGGGGSSWQDSGGNGGIGGGGGGNTATDSGATLTVGLGGGTARNSGANGIQALNNGVLVRGGDGGSNTGSGGGGGSQSGYLNYQGQGGNGGSGIVILRYAI